MIMKNVLTRICLPVLFVFATSLVAVPATISADEKSETKKDKSEKQEAKKDKTKKPVKTRTIKVKDLTLQVPETWKQVQPKKSLRLTEFHIAPLKGDKAGTELALFNFGGGPNVDQNIQRWVGQFSAEGRKVKLTQGNSKQGKYYVIDVSGTFNKTAGPFAGGRPMPIPKSRMLAVILIIEKKGVYYLKLNGPEKTVKSAAAAFRKSFGGNAKKEKPYESDQ
jgi:gluconolactonase